MKNSIFLNLAFCILAISILMTSCTKEDVDIIEEEVIEEPITPALRITMNGTTVQYDAYAAYCNANGKEYLQVSNKSELLGDTIDFTGIQQDDFLFYYIVDGGTAFAIGGTAFEDVPSPGITTLGLDASTNANIVSLDAVSAEGDFSGQMFIPDLNGGGTFVPYAAQFLAEVVQGATYCD